ncbi:beta-glucanase [Streptacidiphilus cavernicola]|uniref:Beta-glucanase n=1 Tax=Streptacidiphilus cavernicola TaxID=3342716 RepID=A0ABV6VZH8_9ACTN
MALPGAFLLRGLTVALLLVPALSAASAGPAVAAAPAGAPSKGRLVFSEQFRARDWGRSGAVWADRTSAYPDGVSDRGDAKLDRLQPAAMTVSGGMLHVTASARSAHGAWQTGLLTTEPWGAAGGDGFQVRTGDYALVRLRLPDRAGGGGHGAWPGVWTWRGGNEVDVLEWHSETPDILEFSNHTRKVPGYDYARSPLVGFGKWVEVGVRFGATDVSWYLGDGTHPLRLAFQDHKGVGAGWHAYLVANLSVSDQPGRVPSSTHPITLAIDRIQVYR